MKEGTSKAIRNASSSLLIPNLQATTNSFPTATTLTRAVKRAMVTASPKILRVFEPLVSFFQESKFFVVAWLSLLIRASNLFDPHTIESKCADALASVTLIPAI